MRFTYAPDLCTEKVPVPQRSPFCAYFKINEQGGRVNSGPLQHRLAPRRRWQRRRSAAQSSASIVASNHRPRFALALGEATKRRVVARATDLAPTIQNLRAGGADSLRAIAAGLNAAGIPTPRGQGKWSAVQVKRTLERI